MKKTIYLVLLMAFAGLFQACSEEHHQPDLDAYIQHYDGYSVTTFHSTLRWNVDPLKTFTVRLIAKNKPVILELQTTCEFTEDYMKVSMIIPEMTRIEDDTYILVSDHFLGKTPRRYLIQFVGEEAEKIDDADEELKKEGYGAYLLGSGSASDPYLIGSSDDFNNFLSVLSIDDHYAAGYYFQQTADIQWRSGAKEENRTLGNLTFAGHYSGDCKRISDLSYSGGKEATEDSDRGIFKALKNGAYLSDLIVDDIYINNAHSRVGAIAGNAEGIVSISNVIVTGHLEANSLIGGLIGSVSNNAQVSILQCKSNLSISAIGEAVGGAVGKCENAALTIRDFHTIHSGSYASAVSSGFEEDPIADRFVVESDGKYVGGVIGHVKNASFEVNGVLLLHSSNTNNDNIRILYAKEYLGGIVGYVESLSATSSIANTELALVYKVADKYVGGCIGYANVTQPLQLSEVLVSGPIHGSESVAAGIGYLQLKESFDLSVDGFKFGSNTYLECPYYCSGDLYVGGFAGRVEGTGAENNALYIRDLEMAGNITAAHSDESYGYVGGIAGFMNKATLELRSSTVGTGSMEVKGPYKVGGLIGELKDGVVDGENSISMNNSAPKIPAKSSLKTCFYGKVLPYDKEAAARYLGGAIGNVINSSVDGLHVNATVTGNGNYTGGVFGFISYDNDKKVCDCSFEGFVDAVHYAGGVVGEIEKKGKLEECINYGTVKGKDHLGGVVGHVQYGSDEPYVNYCVNIGEVTGENFVGGVVGATSATSVHDWCKIHNSANYGTVTGNASSSSPYPGVGGILGKAKDRRCVVQYSVNFGTIIGSGENVCVGGIAGKMGSGSSNTSLNVSLRESANYGEVRSNTSDSYTGGIIGYLERANIGNEDNSIVQNCYNSGYLPSDLSNDAGGIVGCSATYSLIDCCVNYGQVPYGNGIMGTDDGNGTYSNCYTLEGTYQSGSLWPKSVHVFSADEMGSYGYWNDTDLDFSDVWVIQNGRPELRYCPFQYTSRPAN